MIKTNQATLDYQDIEDDNLREALSEFAAHTEMGQDSYRNLDVNDICEYINNESDEDIKQGWWTLLREMQKADVFSVTFMFWW